MSDFMVPQFSTISRCSVHLEARGLLHLKTQANNHNLDNTNLSAAEQNVLLQICASGFCYNLTSQ